MEEYLEIEVGDGCIVNKGELVIYVKNNKVYEWFRIKWDGGGDKGRKERATSRSLFMRYKGH